MSEKPPIITDDEGDMAEAAAGIELLRKMKLAKEGQGAGGSIDTAGLSPESARDIKEAEAGIDLLRRMKEMKSQARKTCQKCGASSPIESNFCGECGNRF